MKTTLKTYLLKTVLALIFYLFFNMYVFSQDVYFPYRIGVSNANNINVNHPDGTKLQDLKRSIGLFVLTTNEKLSGSCSCNLLNNANQDGVPYVSIASHCLKSLNAGEIFDAYFSFDYEMPDALERGNTYDNQSISGIYRVKCQILFKDTTNDLALLDLVNYDPKLLQYAYASGWDNTIGSGSDIWSNISHPKTDHKKVFIDPYFLILDFVHIKNSNRAGYFYIFDNDWNNNNTTLQVGSSGSGFFSKHNLLKGVISFGEENNFGFTSLISNKWYETNDYNFAEYLAPSSNWLNSMPGGYINDLVRTPFDEKFELIMQPNETKVTPSLQNGNPTLLNENVMRLRPRLLFDNLNNLLVPWQEIAGIKADNLNSSDLVLSVYYLDQDPQSRVYTERLLYGISIDDKSPIGNPKELEFKQPYSWDCDNPPVSYPPCNRISSNKYFKAGRSTEFKNRYLQAAIKSNNGEFKPLSLVEIPIKVRLDNIGSSVVNVKAVSYPGDVPKNALQLFKPEEVWAKFKSYKYPESRGQNSEGLYINSLEVSQGDYSKSIPTDNNGGYLNLVNPNFKIGPIKTSIDDENTNTLSFKIAVHTPTPLIYGYSVWIDYYNKEVPGGKNDVNYTYNFVNDPVSHPVELIKQGVVMDGGNISFNYTLPNYTDIALLPDQNRQARLRISIKKGATPPTQDEIFNNGEVEDYLIELFAPDGKEIKEIVESKAKIHLQGGASITDIVFPSTCPSSAPNDSPVSAPSTTQVWDVNPPYTCNTFKGSCNAAGTCSSLVEDSDTAEGTYAINFTGTDDIVTIDNGDLLIHNAFQERTVSLWIKKENITPNKLEVIYDEGGDSDGFAIRLNGSKVELSVLIENQLQTITSTNDIPINQWVNLTGVFNHGEIALYLDGVKQATNNYFKNNSKTIVPIHSDNAGWGGTNSTNVWNASLYHFEGKSDDLLIYDKVLSLGEITALSTPEISSSAKNASPKIDIKDNKDEPLFTIYPNPMKNYLNILVGTTQSGPLHIEITDLNGKKVYEMNRANIEKGDHFIELQNLNLPASIYVLSIKAGDIIRNEKILVE